MKTFCLYTAFFYFFFILKLESCLKRQIYEKTWEKLIEFDFVNFSISRKNKFFEGKKKNTYNIESGRVRLPSVFFLTQGAIFLRKRGFRRIKKEE